MNKIITGALSTALLAMGAIGMAQADGVGGLFGKMFGKRDLAPVANERYRDECGGCHLAFPPGLLTADAWGHLIGSLKNHFGDDVSLTPAVAKELLGYLIANAADGKSTDHSRAVGVKASTADSPPRITETVYFRQRHTEVSVGWVKRNPKVGSFANCQACHTNADQGSFSEEEVHIPSMGQRQD